MRIEPAQHSADRMRDQLLVIDRLDIALLDGIEDIGERTQLLDGKRRQRGLVGIGGEVQADHHTGDDAGHYEPELFQLAAGHEHSIGEYASATPRPRLNLNLVKPHPLQGVECPSLMTDFEV